MKPRFQILLHDLGFVLVQSESRKNIVHLLEREGITWHCHCEDAERNGNKRCKHWAHVESLSPVVAKKDAHRIEAIWAASSPGARIASRKGYPWIYYGVERALGRELEARK